jgi:hypothetical protein
MAAVRTSYELLVGRHLTPATLATFPVAVVPQSVPRNTVHRLRVGADSDLAEIVRRLTERDVALIEIRRCPDRPRWRRGAPQAEPPAEVDGDGVVVAFPSVAIQAADADDDDRVPVPPVALRPQPDGGGLHGRRRRRPSTRD